MEQQTDEEDEEYYKRLLQRKVNESDEAFEKRIDIVRRYLPSLKIWKKDSYKRYITVVKTTRIKPHLHSETTVTRTVTSSSSPDIIDEKEYVIRVVGSLEKEDGETDEKYYKRIFQKRTTEYETEFQKRISVLKRYLPNLNVWKNDAYKRYINLKKPKGVPTPNDERYFKYVFGKTEYESDEEYYTRLFKRYKDESDKEYAWKITLIKNIILIWLFGKMKLTNCMNLQMTLT